MNLLPVVLAFSIAEGALLTRLLPLPSRPRWAAVLFRLSLGTGIGIGLSSCTYYFAWISAGPSTRSLVLFDAVVLIGLLGLIYAMQPAAAGRNAAASPPRRLPGLWGLTAILLLAVALAAVLYGARSLKFPYGGWDAWAVWNLRARFLAQNSEAWRNGFSNVLGATHPDYPLLLPGFVARCWNYLGQGPVIAVPAAVSALFTAATLGLIVSAVALFRSPASGVLAGIVLAGSPSWLRQGPMQYADVPMSFFVLAACVLLAAASPRRSPDPRFLAATGFAAALAAWTKNEGILFLLLLLASYLWGEWRAGELGRGWRGLRWLLAGALPVLALLVHFKLAFGGRTDVFVQQTWPLLVQNVTTPARYPEIAAAFCREALELGNGLWHPALGLLVLAACLGRRPTDRQREMPTPALALGLLLVAYFCIYVITPNDLGWHLSSSLGRLYIQVWPGLIFLSMMWLRSPEETAVAA